MSLISVVSRNLALAPGRPCGAARGLVSRDWYPGLRQGNGLPDPCKPGQTSRVTAGQQCRGHQARVD